MENVQLREKIREKYKTDTAFGMAIGWVPNKVYKFINLNYIPKLSEAVKISRALDINLDELASFFTQ